MNQLAINISSKRENIRIAEKFIDDAKIKYNIKDDVYGNIMIAVIESVSNAIIHGNKLDQNKNVGLVLNIDRSKISILVTDEGIGYDYNNIPDPTLPENLEKPGGRGVYIMKNLCDTVTFRDNGAKIKLVFNV